MANIDLTFPLGNFHADRWGSLWSENGVILPFGNAQKLTAIRLEPSTAKALAAGLSLEIRQREEAHGAIWSEHADKVGAMNDSCLFGASLNLPPEERCEFPTGNSLAFSLYLLVRNLPLNGYEQSFKMLPGSLLSDRFLTGIACSNIAMEDVKFIAESLVTPAAFASAISQDWHDASFFHIGFEQGQQSASYKLYLEFPKGKCKPLYVGYKWNPEDHTQQTITHYSQPEPAKLSRLLEKVASVYEKSDEKLTALVQKIIVLAADKCTDSGTAEALLLVEVREQNTPRYSFDINLYESNLRVSDLAQILEELREYFGIAESEFEKIMTRTRDHLAGHLSGGIDRHGNAFLTLYHARMTAD